MIEMLHCFKLENAKVVFFCEINAKVVEGLKLRFIIMDKQFPRFNLPIHLESRNFILSNVLCIVYVIGLPTLPVLD